MIATLKGRPIGSPLPLLLWLTLLLAAAPPGGAVTPGERVLVIVNDDSLASRQIGAYYAAKRHIPVSHVCHLHCAAIEEVEEAAFSRDILAPVATALSHPALAATVDFLVLTKGVPLRVRSDAPGVTAQFSPNGDSVDGRLMCQDVAGLTSPSRNPFFNARHRFSHKRDRLYLATRLDGYTVKDAEALVDRALRAKPSPGRFVLDGCPERTGGGDPGVPALGARPLNVSLDLAAKSLQARGFRVLLDQTQTFIGRLGGVMGYWSWGSNDPHFAAALYKGNSWRPGALAETAVSTSARTMLPTTGGQSLIADLVASGVTGVKGYVAEPYTLAMAQADILFDRYTRGWTLAESFYCASPVVHWKDVVLGDPLCAPYAGKSPTPAR